MKYVLALALFAVAAASAAAAQRPRPVVIRGDPNLDSCPQGGEVRGLNPRGHNYLSVRAGPHVRARELDRLRAGQEVVICDGVGNGQWWGVIYSRNPSQDCNLGAIVGRPWPYRGPCRSGWVAGRYVRITG
jgi:hypothetical protein